MARQFELRPEQISRGDLFCEVVNHDFGFNWEVLQVVYVNPTTFAGQFTENKTMGDCINSYASGNGNVYVRAGDYFLYSNSTLGSHILMGDGTPICHVHISDAVARLEFTG